MAASDGVRVIELGQIYNGPYCGLLLAYLGAEVIKVELLAGDRLRSVGEDAHEFLMFDWNKSSIALNLEVPGARELCLDLVRGADVVIENYKNGIMSRMGLGCAGYPQHRCRLPALEDTQRPLPPMRRHPTGERHCLVDL